MKKSPFSDLRKFTKETSGCLLDTNFIIGCAKNKLDFIEDISFLGLKILIPNEVIKELKRISESNQKGKDRNSAKLALRLLEKEDYKKIDLQSSYVDKGIIKLAKENPEMIVATLDKELQKKIRNRKLIIRGKKKLEFI